MENGQQKVTLQKIFQQIVFEKCFSGPQNDIGCLLLYQIKKPNNKKCKQSGYDFQS